MNARNQDNDVGSRLYVIRKKAKLSISELASNASVSAGMISQIERGKSNPSIKILDRLRVALDVPLTALLEESPHRKAQSHHIRCNGHRPTFTVGDEGMTKELLSPTGAQDLQLMLITLPPGAASDDVLLGEGEKGGLVLDGVLTIAVDGEVIILYKGDSFQFRSHLSHSVSNLGKTTAHFLWIINLRQSVAPI